MQKITPEDSSEEGEPEAENRAQSLREQRYRQVLQGINQASTPLHDPLSGAHAAVRPPDALLTPTDTDRLMKLFWDPECSSELIAFLDKPSRRNILVRLLWVVIEDGLEKVARRVWGQDHDLLQRRLEDDWGKHAALCLAADLLAASDNNTASEKSGELRWRDYAQTPYESLSGDTAPEDRWIRRDFDLFLRAKVIGSVSRKPKAGDVTSGLLYKRFLKVPPYSIIRADVASTDGTAPEAGSSCPAAISLSPFVVNNRLICKMDPGWIRTDFWGCNNVHKRVGTRFVYPAESGSRDCLPTCIACRQLYNRLWEKRPAEECSASDLEAMTAADVVSPEHNALRRDFWYRFLQALWQERERLAACFGNRKPEQLGWDSPEKLWENLVRRCDKDPAYYYEAPPHVRARQREYARQQCRLILSRAGIRANDYGPEYGEYALVHHVLSPPEAHLAGDNDSKVGVRSETKDLP